ncbi:MAG: prepilin-type N-terminal cleavage/methylation domain-containing protein, partial [Gammaproteobacteria bacterium]
MKHKGGLFRQRGSSLIEILITIVVLGITLTALASFQGNVSESNNLAKQKTIASKLAEKKIEQLRDLRNSDAFNQLLNASSGQTTVPYEDATYTVDWNVSASGGSSKFATITTTVTWNGHEGEPHTVTLSSIAGDDAPLQVASLSS